MKTKRIFSYDDDSREGKFDYGDEQDQIGSQQATESN